MFRILIAEDDAALRQMFCRVLSRSGFDPIPVADGQEALGFWKKNLSISSFPIL